MQYPERFTINLDPETRQRLHAAAQSAGITAAAFVRLTVRQALRDPRFLVSAMHGDSMQNTATEQAEVSS